MNLIDLRSYRGFTIYFTIYVVLFTWSSPIILPDSLSAEASLEYFDGIENHPRSNLCKGPSLLKDLEIPEPNLKILYFRLHNIFSKKVTIFIAKKILEQYQYK